MLLGPIYIYVYIYIYILYIYKVCLTVHRLGNLYNFIPAVYHSFNNLISAIQM